MAECCPTANRAARHSRQAAQIWLSWASVVGRAQFGISGPFAGQRRRAIRDLGANSPCGRGRRSIERPQVHGHRLLKSGRGASALRVHPVGSSRDSAVSISAGRLWVIKSVLHYGRTREGRKSCSPLFFQRTCCLRVQVQRIGSPVMARKASRICVRPDASRNSPGGADCSPITYRPVSSGCSTRS